jgi:mannose-6-phosphate isomerase-like protein (cupin superfamily)
MGIGNISDIIRNMDVRPDLKIGLRDVYHNGTMSFNVGVVTAGVPDHYHKISDEMYYIHTGTGRMRINDEYSDVTGGDIITIPKGSIHGLENTGPRSMIIFIVTSPPFDPEHDRFVV